MIDFEIVIPAYNEEEQVKGSILTLRKFLLSNFVSEKWLITVADNASTDKTPEIMKNLSNEYPDIHYLRLEQKGRGRALKKAWGASDARIVAYMDVDLSTHIKHIPELINSLKNNDNVVSIGSRLLSKSVIKRSLKREVISRIYNSIVKIIHQTKFSDAQCGFKAIRQNIFEKISPLIKNNEWFFDSELLIIAEKMGYKIYEIPVEWNEDMGSTVKIIPTAMEDLKGLWRLYKEKPWKTINSKFEIRNSK
jgi:glycosyltransferase involved in cell wall biosynthesis